MVNNLCQRSLPNVNIQILIWHEKEKIKKQVKRAYRLDQQLVNQTTQRAS